MNAYRTLQVIAGLCNCTDDDRPTAPTVLTYSNLTSLPGGKVSALVSWHSPASDSRFIVDKYKVHSFW